MLLFECFMQTGKTKANLRVQEDVGFACMQVESYENSVPSFNDHVARDLQQPF